MNVKNKEAGIVSIVVTIIIMLLISIVVIAFAQLVRREQRQALDRQLNTQAFYAAETGVNDVVKAIRDAGVVTPLADYTSNCTSFITDKGLNKTVGNAADGVEYTCAFVDPSPTNLDFSNVDVSESKVFPLRAKNPADTISQVTVGWEDKSGNSNFAGCPAIGTFPQNWPGNCTVGIMRVDIVPFGGSMSRDQLATQTFTAFLQPRPSGASGIVSYANGIGNEQGVVVGANCSNVPDRDCTATISGLPGGNNYFMRIRSVYRASAATICSPNCSSGIELTGAQALVDVTGKAADVLKRIQVRVPIGQSGTIPEFAIQTNDSQCKRFSIIPGQILLDSTANSVPNNACDPNTL